MINQVHNMDCIIAMKQMEDNQFDLAIVDPVYGDVTKGGYTSLYARTAEYILRIGLRLMWTKMMDRKYITSLFSHSVPAVAQR